jgi:hypothetical protein
MVQNRKFFAFDNSSTKVAILAVIGACAIAGCQKQVSEASSDAAGAAISVDAGLDRRANSSIALSGNVSGGRGFAPLWSASSAQIKIEDPASLTSTVAADVDGTYVITLAGKDAAGKEISDSMTLEWDTTPPGSPLLSKATGSGFSKSAGLSLEIIGQTPADFGSYRYVTGSLPLTSCADGTETSGVITVQSTADVALKVVACDSLGNMSAPTESTFLCSDCDNSGESDDGQDGDGSDPVTHSVTVNSPANLTVTPSAEQTILDGQTLSYSLTAAANFEVSTNPLPGGTCPQGAWNGNQYTTGAIVSDCNISFADGSPIPNYSVTAVGVFDYPSAYTGKNWDGAQLIAEPSKTTVRGQVVSFTVALPTPWHRIVSTTGGSCPSGTWSGETYTTGPITSNCTVNLHVDTGDIVSFSAIKTILGTKTQNSSSYVNGTLTDSTASGACIGCHAKAVESSGTTTASSPSGQFSMTSTLSADVTLCDTSFAPFTSANECRADKIDHAKLTDNIRWDTKIKAIYTSGSNIVTVTSVDRLAVGNRIDNVAFPTASSVTIQAIGPNAGEGLAANQIKVSANASASGTLPINVVLSTTSTSTKILQRDEPFFCTSTQCYTEKYRRVDPGSPKTSLFCIKPQPLTNTPAAAGGATRNMQVAGWLDSIKPSDFTFSSSGGQPRDRAMPSSGSWYIGDANVEKICRWILQGAQNN